MGSANLDNVNLVICCGGLWHAGASPRMPPAEAGSDQYEPHLRGAEAPHYQSIQGKANLQ
jgi:hypothetical protein